jgi:hypothetical protein
METQSETGSTEGAEGVLSVEGGKPFNARPYLIKVQRGADYLPVAARVVWFRRDHPAWSITTALVNLDMRPEKGTPYAIFSATISDDKGNIIATGHKQEDAKGFPDFLEKAETGAIGRALANCGYGTLQCLDLDDGAEERMQRRPSQAPQAQERPQQPPTRPQTPAQAPQNNHAQTPQPPQQRRPTPATPQINGASSYGAIAEGEDFGEDPFEDDDIKRERQNFYAVCRNMKINIPSEAEEKRLINGTLNRTGDAAEIAPTAQEYNAAAERLPRVIAAKRREKAAAAAQGGEGASDG